MSTSVADVLTGVYLFAFFGGLLGMFFFYSYAKWLFLLIFPTGFLSAALGGSYVYSPIKPFSTLPWCSRGLSV